MSSSSFIVHLCGILCASSLVGEGGTNIVRDQYTNLKPRYMFGAINKVLEESLGTGFAASRGIPVGSFPPFVTPFRVSVPASMQKVSPAGGSIRVAPKALPGVNVASLVAGPYPAHDVYTQI